MEIKLEKEVVAILIYEIKSKNDNNKMFTVYSK